MFAVHTTLVKFESATIRSHFLIWLSGKSADYCDVVFEKFVSSNQNSLLILQIYVSGCFVTSSSWFWGKFGDKEFMEIGNIEYLMLFLNYNLKLKIGRCTPNSCPPTCVVLFRMRSTFFFLLIPFKCVPKALNLWSWPLSWSIQSNHSTKAILGRNETVAVFAEEATGFGSWRKGVGLSFFSTRARSSPACVFQRSLPLTESLKQATTPGRKVLSCHL